MRGLPGVEIGLRPEFFGGILWVSKILDPQSLRMQIRTIIIHDMPPSSSMPPRAATPESSGADAPGALGQGVRACVRRVASGELFGNATELVIVHGQREYRLRVTSNGKLILTA
jgi:hemin uptake protein HemP